MTTPETPEFDKLNDVEKFKALTAYAIPKDDDPLVIQQFIIKLPKTVTGFINTFQQTLLKAVIKIALRISQGMGAGTNTKTQSQWRTLWKSNEMRNQESKTATMLGTPSTLY